MAKIKSAFFCQNCGAQSPKWIGKCPSCNEWNTYVEETQSREKPPSWKSGDGGRSKSSKPRLITEIQTENSPRLRLPDAELNRVLGGGLVQGSLILLGGEPGIGKSTLLLQLAISMAGKKILYVSGEESDQQVRMRAERIGTIKSVCYLLSETSLGDIFRQIGEIEPDILIIDSIQTLHSENYESAPGSVSQIRGCAAELLRYAKESNTPVFLIGHITKEGSIAGPKVLEHMVDTVLQFEGDRNHVFRLLRAAKNRFGSTAEMGIYEMKGEGLREVDNPSQLLLAQRDQNLSGTCIAATLEGARPLLIEVQSLVSSAVYGTPQRSATGFDLRRLNMLLAVLEKRCGFRLGAKDVFLNIAGGIRVDDPAIDLAVICAILSSSEDISIAADLCFAAETGLTGEIRPVNRVENRVREAERMGFSEIFVSTYNLEAAKKVAGSIRVNGLAKVEDAFSRLFG